MITLWIQAFLSVITGFTSGLAGGIVDLFDTLLVDGTGSTQTLTTVAIVGVLTVGTGFIIGLVRSLIGRFSHTGK